MTVLVTGAGGGVGRALCARLRQEGFEVRGLDRQIVRLPAGVDLWVGDVCDPVFIEQALKGVEAVFHCAGVVRFSRADLAEQLRVHEDGARILAEAMRRVGAGRLVYMSSVGSLGPRETPTLLDETADVREGPVRTGYGVTKRHGEIIIEEAAKQGLDAVLVLPSGIFGHLFHPLQRRTLVMPLLAGALPRLFSGGFNCVSMEDVVEGCLRAWRQGRSGQRYILGGENLLFRELAEAITQPAGVRPPARTWSTRQAWGLERLIGLWEHGASRLRVDTDASVDAFRSNQLYLFTTHEKAARDFGYRPGPVRPVIAEAVSQLLKEDTAGRWLARLGQLRTG